MCISNRYNYYLNATSCTCLVGHEWLLLVFNCSSVIHSFIHLFHSIIMKLFNSKYYMCLGETNASNNFSVCLSNKRIMYIWNSDVLDFFILYLICFFMNDENWNWFMYWMWSGLRTFIVNKLLLDIMSTIFSKNY